MRPLPGDESLAGRSRSTSFDNDVTPLASRSHAPQMTYFLADEKSLESSQSPSPTILPRPREHLKNSSYGVESLETTISSLADNGDAEESVKKARHNWKKNLGQRMSRKSEEDLTGSVSPSLSSMDVSRNVSPSFQRRPSQATISRPFTPLSFGSPAPRSTMSSPDSRRNSDAGSFMDDSASQAIMSSGEEEESTPAMMDSGSAPQLVMPSIKMPSRRPFTEKGKNMGRLKVLIVGDSGVGKTSLIKAIVQTCEDIVHVDPISTSSIPITDTKRKDSGMKSRGGLPAMQSTSCITEVYASTKAYPAWWSDLEESRILRRRKSMGDSILERNLCFVDTPGYGNKTSFSECIEPVIDYIESHFKRASSPENFSESDTVNMLSGNGGSQVDVVLYVMSNQVKTVDIEYLRRLSHLTNVIPVIARGDTFSKEELSFFKETVISELDSANIRPFLFGVATESPSSQPYAISTATSKDHETMDASLLMSPDYVQPLLPSELQVLVSQLFDRDTMSWLRHSAAKKYLAWRASSTPISRPLSLYRPLPSSPTPHLLTTPMGSIGATSSYALARITDHTLREERLAQVHLAKWAADLQRSMQNERARFDAVARSERAVWLTERLGECVQDGSIIPVSQARREDWVTAPGSGALVRPGTYWRNLKGERDEIRRAINPHDPLRLLALLEDLRRNGWIVVRIIGGVSILGGLAIFLARSFRVSEVEESWWGFALRDWI